MRIDARCQESFERQGPMRPMGVKLVAPTDGHAGIEGAYRADLTQQHGYFDGSVVTVIAGPASGDAASNTMLINPAAGDRLRGR